MIHRHSFSLLFAVASLANLPGAALAQRATGGPKAFGVAFAGAVAGSAVGVAVGIGLAEARACPSDDLRCELRRAGTVILLSIPTATVGSVVASRAARTRHSLIGATLGSVAGAAAGIGAAHLVSEELNLTRGRYGQLVAYVVVQGAVTALASVLTSSSR